MTHFLRSVHEGILVGVGTVASDNPSLTVRHVKGEACRLFVEQRSGDL